ncbi:trypsin-like serine peptidase [Amycolatopsis nigrescens]|uniref:trypsin-like serine peptidase n=1 Tax=Amycolatopsis nigrescens TaxID=381445 RepID=UPI000370D8B8|nr:trypsin-like peptidase domain-containing protein [Amycolatopsis nigrescens]
MAAAEPESSGSAPVPTSEPGVDTALPPTPGSLVLTALTASPRPYTDPGERVHGKVFYTKGGRNTWCSSAVATAPNKSLVWTAAHCVSGAANVMFVPAYNSAGDDDAPYGRWPARLVQTSGNDHAVVVVGQVGDRSLEDVVGANGIRFNGPVANRTTIWGYPGARQWTGRDLTYCDERAQPSGASVRTSCVTQPGSSGGGYVTGAATPAGLGYLWANHTAGDGASYAIGSVFGATAKQLYDANSSR